MKNSFFLLFSHSLSKILFHLFQRKIYISSVKWIFFSVNYQEIKILNNFKCERCLHYLIISLNTHNYKYNYSISRTSQSANYLGNFENNKSHDISHISHISWTKSFYKNKIFSDPLSESKLNYHQTKYYDHLILNGEKLIVFRYHHLDNLSHAALLINSHNFASFFSDRWSEKLCSCKNSSFIKYARSRKSIVFHVPVIITTLACATNCICICKCSRK